MRVLLSSVSAPHYMAPPVLSDDQVNCGPFFPDREIDGRTVSFATPRGDYDLSLLAARLPSEQQPELVVCLVDSSWFSKPHNFTAFKCPKIALIADTHHMQQPILGMVRYLKEQKFDRHVLLYTRHHLEIFRAAGLPHLHWLPGLTFPHNDAVTRAARRAQRNPCITMIGQSGNLHQRRLSLAGAVAEAGLPLVFREGTQRQSLEFYGASLLGLNVTANADLNLRALEIAAAGTLHLMDRLSPESGVASLWQDGREYVSFANAADLVERARHFIARPDEARRVGDAAARWFDRHLNAARRRRLFEQIVTEGRDDPMFALPAPSRFVRAPFGGRTNLFVVALAIYEHLQQLHSVAEVLRVQADESVPPDFARLCATLPRVIVARNFAADEPPDYLVTTAARALALKTLPAPRLWCWDATAEALPRIAAHFTAAGLRAVRDNVAFFVQPPAEARPVNKLAAEARGRLQHCEPAAALELARRALAEDAGCVDAFLVIAELAMEAGNAELGRKMLAKARELAPADPRIPLLQLASSHPEMRQRPAERLLNRAMRHVSGDEILKAKALAVHATKADPRLATASHWLGRISLQLGAKLRGEARQAEIDAGLAALRRAVGLAPTRADFARELGLALHQLGRAGEAVPALQQAAEADPLDPTLWVSLAEALLAQGGRDRAVAALSRGLEFTPDDGLLRRTLERAKTRPVVAPTESAARGASGAARDSALLDRITGVLNTVDLHPHEQALRLAAIFAGIAAHPPAGWPLPGRRAVMLYQPWFDVPVGALVGRCLERGQLLALCQGEDAPRDRHVVELDSADFRQLSYRGVNLWLVARYRLALQLRKMTEQIDPAQPADGAALRDVFALARTQIDTALAYFDCYRPDTLIVAQGHELASAIFRQLAIQRGVRVVALENVFRKDRLLWEDLSGISVHQNLARNYFWRHRDLVSDDEAAASVERFLAQMKAAKSGEHASPATRVPDSASSALPTIAYLAQVGTDSSVLFGLRGFASQVDVIVALANYAVARGVRLLVKLHPKENPAFKDEMTMLRGLTAAGLAADAQFAALRAQMGSRLVLDDANRYDTYDMIRQAGVCVTINSQAGLESAILGREVVLCGDAFYGSLGFTHEAVDARSLAFVLDRILLENWRLNKGSTAAKFFHVFTELYCLPKTVESVLRLLDGRPMVAVAPAPTAEADIRRSESAASGERSAAVAAPPERDLVQAVST